MQSVSMLCGKLAALSWMSMTWLVLLTSLAVITEPVTATSGETSSYVVLPQTMVTKLARGFRMGSAEAVPGPDAMSNVRTKREARLPVASPPPVELEQNSPAQESATSRGREATNSSPGTFSGPRSPRAGSSQVRVGQRFHPSTSRISTGEVQTIAGKVGGLGVVIGARVGASAGPSEVLASQTVKDLIAGSGLTFEDRGEHALKGVPDRWRLYQVVN